MNTYVPREPIQLILTISTGTPQALTFEVGGTSYVFGESAAIVEDPAGTYTLTITMPDSTAEGTEVPYRAFGTAADGRAFAQPTNRRYNYFRVR